MYEKGARGSTQENIRFPCQKRRFHSYKLVQLFDEAEGSDYSLTVCALGLSPEPPPHLYLQKV